MDSPSLHIIPLGGLGEVGKNMMAFQYGTEAIIIDTGIMFPENDMLGIAYIIPDFKFLTQRDDFHVLGAASCRCARIAPTRTVQAGLPLKRYATTRLIGSSATAPDELSWQLLHRSSHVFSTLPRLPNTIITKWRLPVIP